MEFINNIKDRVKQNLKTIVLPESMDRRVIEAAIKSTNEEIAKIVLIGNKEEIINANNDLDFSNIEIIDPQEVLDEYANDLYELRREKGMTLEEAQNLILNDYMYLACMLAYKGKADGVVSGACHSTANTLRPSLQIIKTSPDADLVSAFFLMVVPNCEYGENGVFVFSDAGLNQNPTSSELSSIAASSAKSFELLTNKEAIVAMLSHSTYGSSKHPDVDKVVEAVKIAKEKYPNIKLDGELQVDAALVKSVGESKAPGSEVAGFANTLIFPDLDAGNIGYKLVQRLAKAEAYGPITQGMNKPVNDLSRGCSVDDIVGVIAITSLQAGEKDA